MPAAAAVSSTHLASAAESLSCAPGARVKSMCVCMYVYIFIYIYIYVHIYIYIHT